MDSGQQWRIAPQTPSCSGQQRLLRIVHGVGGAGCLITLQVTGSAITSDQDVFFLALSKLLPVHVQQKDGMSDCEVLKFGFAVEFFVTLVVSGCCRPEAEIGAVSIYAWFCRQPYIWRKRWLRSNTGYD